MFTLMFGYVQFVSITHNLQLIHINSNEVSDLEYLHKESFRKVSAPLQPYYFEIVPGCHPGLKQNF